MPTLGQKLWEMGKSPPENMGFLIFGLFSLLAGVIARSLLLLLAGAAYTSLLIISIILSGVGAFFVAVALFLAAFAGSEKGEHTAWRIALLIAAIVVLVFIL